MKYVTIGSASFSKVICGANAFWGHSHFSEARDAEYLARFDDETIERTIRRCLALGINTVESCGNARILSAISRLQKSGSEPIHFVGSTRIDETSPIKSHQEKLSFLIEEGFNVRAFVAARLVVHDPPSPLLVEECAVDYESFQLSADHCGNSHLVACVALGT